MPGQHAARVNNPGWAEVLVDFGTVVFLVIRNRSFPPSCFGIAVYPYPFPVNLFPAFESRLITKKLIACDQFNSHAVVVFCNCHFIYWLVHSALRVVRAEAR